MKITIINEIGRTAASFPEGDIGIGRIEIAIGGQKYFIGTSPSGGIQVWSAKPLAVESGGEVATIQNPKCLRIFESIRPGDVVRSVETGQKLLVVAIANIQGEAMLECLTVNFWAELLGPSPNLEACVDAEDGRCWFSPDDVAFIERSIIPPEKLKEWTSKRFQ